MSKEVQALLLLVYYSLMNSSAIGIMKGDDNNDFNKFNESQLSRARFAKGVERSAR